MAKKHKGNKWKLVKPNDEKSRECVMLQYMYSLHMPLRGDRTKKWLMQAMNDRNVKVAAVAEQILSLNMICRSHLDAYEWEWEEYPEDDLICRFDGIEDEFTLDMLSEEECREIFIQNEEIIECL